MTNQNNRIRRVTAILKKLAYMPMRTRSTVQLEIVRAIRDIRPGAKVQFDKANSVIPTGAFAEASEYTGSVQLYKGDTIEFYLKIQYAEDNWGGVYEAVWRRTDKAEPVITIGATTIDQIIRRLAKALDKTLPWKS